MLTEHLFCSIMFYMDTIVQLRMPHSLLGNPESLNPSGSFNSKSFFPGCRVVYLGNINGGPRKGSTGIVLKTAQNKVFVELDKKDNWYIPKFLLRPLN